MSVRLRPLRDEVELAIRDMEARAPGLAARRPGSVLNAVAGVGALLKRDAERFALAQLARTFFQTASGSDLDELALDHLGLRRLGVSPARGEVTVLRESGEGTLLAEEGTVLLDPSGEEYLVTERVQIVGVVGKVRVAARRGGRAGNRVGGTVLRGPNWAATLYTEEGLAGGDDGETDEEFRERIALWWRGLRRGTAAALRLAARGVGGVRHVSVDETRSRPHRGGIVDLYVADLDGGWNGLLLREVREVVDRDARSAGVVVNVRAGRVRWLRVELRVTYRPGAGSAVVSRVVEGVSREANRLGMGEGLRRGRLEAAALGADRLVARAVVLDPPGDVEVGTGELLRLRREDLVLT